MIYKLLYFFTLIHSSTGFWWWFASDVDSMNDNSQGEIKVDTNNVAVQMFAPFEITVMEQKFLSEAQHYLQNLPMLDQCNLLIINRLKTSCNKLSDQELSKLSVNLLNCQSAVEGRTLYSCTDEMALADCTKPMDPDTWNSYHIISNRARAICHSVRQAEFRMKTEQTVNHLASATLENVNMLKNLASGQKELQAAADEAINSITSNQKDIMLKQDEFKEKQLAISDVMSDNMNNLIHEKQVISQRHKQVEEYTQMINYQLAALVKEIKSQELSKKETEQELLKDLDSVKSKADEVLKKLEVAFVDMDTYHENVESKQNKTLKNLEEIQEAISFMNDVCKIVKVLTKLSTSIHEQLPWLQDMFGGTMDKLTIMTLILGHIMFFVCSFFIILFINAPGSTRIVLLVVVPVNCLAALQALHSLTYQQLAWFLALTIPVTYIFEKIRRLISSIYYQSNGIVVVKSTLTKDDVARDLSSILSIAKVTCSDVNENFCPKEKRDPKIETLQHDDIIVRTMSSTPEKLYGSRTLSMLEQKQDLTFDSPPMHLTPPLKRRSMHNTTLNGLDTTVGGSVKCTAYTRTGTRCRNGAVSCSTTCRVHTPQKI